MTRYKKEGELYRRRGELLMIAGDPQADEAETCLQQALAITRRQQAKWWELRTAKSLSRLWQQQGKGQAAYDLLAPVYGWFTEGFDIADMKDAKTLLAELRAGETESRPRSIRFSACSGATTLE